MDTYAKEMSKHAEVKAEDLEAEDREVKIK
jgi:hypothetical protein